MQQHLDALIRSALSAAQEAGELAAFDLADTGIERPADPSNGDWSSTAALRSAKLAHAAPRAIAQAIAAHIPADPALDRVEIAGPGFINFLMYFPPRAHTSHSCTPETPNHSQVPVSNGIVLLEHLLAIHLNNNLAQGISILQ